MAELAGKLPVILMGDFNDSANRETPSYRILVIQDDQPILSDTWSLASRGQRMRGEGTFHGFTGETTRGRIDWILISHQWPGVDSGIDRTEKNGRYPSDHFPVWVIFRQERR